MRMTLLFPTGMRHDDRTFTVAGKEFRVRRQGVARLLALREEILDSIEDPEEVIAEARRQRVPADILTFTEHLPDLTPRFNYRMEWDNLAVLPISTHEEWLRNQVHRNTRKAVRRAQRCGVVVQAHPFGRELAKKLVEIFNETSIRRGKPYPYFGRTAEQVEQDWKPDVERSDFLLATVDTEPVGFIKLLYHPAFARASGTIAKLSHRDKKPMNALLSRAVELCAERRIPHLIYGKFEYPGQTDFGLTEFKKHNGFDKVSVPRYYVPVSSWGRLALAMRLHCQVSTWIPARSRRAFKALRSKWIGYVAVRRAAYHGR